MRRNGCSFWVSLTNMLAAFGLSFYADYEANWMEAEKRENPEYDYGWGLGLMRMCAQAARVVGVVVGISALLIWTLGEEKAKQRGLP